MAQGITDYYVVITATDSVDAESSADVTIPDPFASDNSGTDSGDDTSEESSGLPSIGMFASIIAMLGAALLSRKD
jgi:non-canonical (house-cleaning) NTP pyrophosphatase